MIPRLFITGGNGFVGRRLIEALLRRGASLVLLDRSGALEQRLQGTTTGNADIVRADLLDHARYAAALSTAGAVLHLAAATGRASAQEHQRTNAAGTRVLLEQMRRTGVQRVLFTSSIAAKFPRTSGYPYAESKRRAESDIREFDLRFTILRPTIILGPGSPILSALSRLAELPIIPIFGHGRTQIQPIHVDDLVDFIIAIVEQDRFHGETLELGGAESLSMEELIQRIRRLRRGSAGLPVHVPIGLISPILRAADAVGLGRLMPFTAGQLSSFMYDGRIEKNSLHESRRASLRPIAAMVNSSAGA